MDEYKISTDKQHAFRANGFVGSALNQFFLYL